MDEWEALRISLQGARSVHPKNGFVPDDTTAVRIGEATAVAQYGEKTISEGADGGTAVVKINKADGRILFMTHQM